MEASPLTVVSGGPRALAPGDLEVPRVRVDIRGVGVWGVSGVTDGDPDRRGLILGHKTSLFGRTTLFQKLPRDDAAFFYICLSAFFQNERQTPLFTDEHVVILEALWNFFVFVRVFLL